MGSVSVVWAPHAAHLVGEAGNQLVGSAEGHRADQAQRNNHPEQRPIQAKGGMCVNNPCSTMQALQGTHALIGSWSCSPPQQVHT